MSFPGFVYNRCTAMIQNVLNIKMCVLPLWTNRWQTTLTGSSNRQILAIEEGSILSLLSKVLIPILNWHKQRVFSRLLQLVTCWPPMAKSGAIAAQVVTIYPVMIFTTEAAFYVKMSANASSFTDTWSNTSTYSLSSALLNPFRRRHRDIQGLIMIWSRIFSYPFTQTLLGSWRYTRTRTSSSFKVSILL
jgi:hypothetical protein